MSRLSAHKTLHKEAKTVEAADHLAEQTADRLISLTQRLRANKIQDNFWNRTDFNRTMRLGGRCFLLNDLISLVCAYLMGVLLASIYNVHANHYTGIGVLSSTFPQFMVSLGLGLMAILWLDTKGHYRQRLPYWESLGHFAKVSLIGFICGGFIQYAVKDSYSRLQLGLFWVMFGVFMLVGRSITRRILTRQNLWNINTLIIGNKSSAHAIHRALAGESSMGFHVAEQLSPESLTNMGGDRAWKQLLMLYEANHVFVALEGSEMEKYQTALRSMVRSRIPHSIVPPWLGLPSSNLSPHHFMMNDVFFLQNTSRLRMPLLRLFKRSFDIAASLAAILALSPLLLIVMLMVRRDGGPAFFRQPRVGKNGQLFDCYKFRSMRVDAEAFLTQYLADHPAEAQEWAQYQKLHNDVRVTRFGNLIRRTSIDELPQLFNVLKGDMSLVGPRPIIPEQAEFYGDDFCFYESVRPGITGPWQVSGRSKLTFQERVALESWYARNWNPWTDIAIIFKTVPTLLKRGHAV